MEFLLPVALKLFPGMLPSTFETANEKVRNNTDICIIYSCHINIVLNTSIKLTMLKISIKTTHTFNSKIIRIVFAST
ncbi:LETM1 and EF-hand domain-containing protein 1, mitochondrial [Portunus trituberculatus]|uniref:LETM1 and EF-hand domain-containing protein 1, mitochondrial n=1 Tax=Portunus trituberculatus TaxID=210409 RepID=A0A5B7HQL8_PORTR|nr:LETM1 and EF-hand domain-containing protein 1, mitochondrial [Portunus trituberculatus]